MRVFTNHELKTFKYLASMSQPALKKTLAITLRKLGYPNVIETEHYIIAEGSIPIALVAHMDTVFASPPKEIFYDQQANVMWSPQGLGADDRAGVFATLQILKSGLKPHVIFTTDEEKGGMGAIALALAHPEFPFADLRYMIQLDRQGANDCVFYDCDNLEFTTYVESFGFVETWGTFSDISELAPEWGVAAVNLSVGYRDEHSREEILFVGHLLATIEKVKRMLIAEPIPKYEYIPCSYGYGSWKYPYSYDYGYDYGYGYKHYPKDKTPARRIDKNHCYQCGKYFLEEELFPAALIEGGEGNFCPDCVVDHVHWCINCGKAFEVDPDEIISHQLCKKCREDMDRARQADYPRED